MEDTKRHWSALAMVAALVCALALALAPAMSSAYAEEETEDAVTYTVTVDPDTYEISSDETIVFAETVPGTVTVVSSDGTTLVYGVDYIIAAYDLPEVTGEDLDDYSDGSRSVWFYIFSVDGGDFIGSSYVTVTLASDGDATDDEEYDFSSVTLDPDTYEISSGETLVFATSVSPNVVVIQDGVTLTLGTDYEIRYDEDSVSSDEVSSDDSEGDDLDAYYERVFVVGIGDYEGYYGTSLFSVTVSDDDATDGSDTSDATDGSDTSDATDGSDTSDATDGSSTSSSSTSDTSTSSDSESLAQTGDGTVSAAAALALMGVAACIAGVVNSKRRVF